MFVEIDYTNWRGVRGTRVIKPLMLTFTSNEWYPEPCWLVYAIDLHKDASRWFAMNKIHSWKEVGSAKIAAPG